MGTPSTAPHHLSAPGPVSPPQATLSYLPAIVYLVDWKLGWNSWTDSALTSVMGQQL